MVGRRYSRKRSYRPKRTFKRTTKKVVSVVRRELSKIIEPETYDQGFTTAIVSGTPQFKILLPQTADATSSSYSRSSKKILSLQLRGTFTNADSTTDHWVRAMLVKDNYPTELANDVTDIIAGEFFNSLPKVQNKKRFKILRDWRMIIVGNTEGHPATRMINFYKKINKVIQYRYLTDTWRPAQQYYLILMSDDTAGGVTNEIYSRVSFIDA